MIQVAFFVGAIGAVGGALAVVAMRNPFYSVLSLIVHLVSLAGLFLLLHAQFVAAAQVVVYAGAVMVLYVFVAAYVGQQEESLYEPIAGQRFLAPLLGVALFVELSVAVLGTTLSSLSTRGPTIALGFGSPASIGSLLLERFLIVFEAASMLLLVAAVAAITLAGKRRGITPPTSSAGITPPTSSASRPVSTGSGADGVAGMAAGTGASSLAQADGASAPGDL